MDTPLAVGLVEAVVGHRPLSAPLSIPGATAVAVTLSSHGHLAQVACTTHRPPRTALFPPSEPTLATRVASLQRGLACSRSKCTSFVDATTLLGEDGPCESVACVPLTNAGVPLSTPWGALTVAFRSGTISRDAALAVHALAGALAAPECRLSLQSHLDVIVEALLAPPHSLDEEEPPNAGPWSPILSEDSRDAGPSGLPRLAALCCATETARNANDDIDTPSMQPPSPTGSASSSDSGWSAASGMHSTEEQHPLWMTFRSPAVERNYTKWVAMHMRYLDPAATLFACSYFVAMGVSPSFAMALRHPAAWLAGGAALVPMWLCLLPPTARFYLARRETCLTAFHAFSLAWHMITLNGTTLLCPTLFPYLGRSPAAFLSWQAVNLLMFQMRWWQLVTIAAVMFVSDVLTAAAPLCRLFASVGIPQDPQCASMVVSAAALQLIAALVVLRFNEQRMRRLFVEHLTEPPAKRRAKFWFLRRFKLLGEGGMPVAVEMPRYAEGMAGGKMA